ncbi:MAG: hypothetical protein WCG75_05985, partial [Armatimonadota bacterium]
MTTRQSGEVPKVKTRLFVVVGTFLVLVVLRLVVAANLGAEPERAKPGDKPGSGSTRVYEPGIPPSGMFTPKLTRSNIDLMPIIDMNDRGDMLLLSSPPTAKYREFVHVFNGKSIRSEQVEATARWVLTPSGNILKMGRATQIRSSGFISQSYNELRFFKRITDDGSVIYTNTTQRRKAFNYQLLKSKNGMPNEMLYSSNNPLLILEIEESGAIWLRETFEVNKIKHDQLLRISATGTEKIALPRGYNLADRVATCKSVVVATFGQSSGLMPFRSFRRTSNGWEEMPTPKGSMFTFVQRALFSGLVLGFATDQSRTMMKQIVWKGNEIGILDDCPMWPKVGQFAVVVRATRRGDIYVQSVLNT